MVQEQRFWLLYSLKLSGEATPEELSELNILMEQHPDFLNRLKMLDSLWKEKSESSIERKEKAFDKHLQRLSIHLSQPILQYEDKKDVAKRLEIKKEKSGFSYRRLWWGSAIAASVLLCWVFFNTNSSQEKAHQKLANNIISTKPGSKTSIRLPDGSKVWLNSDSKITYSGEFQGKTREVHLSGEAFFDVAKDKTRPFIIHTQTIDLKVLGTAFNVRSYANERETETSLVHGSIEVTLKNNPGKKIILKPSEKLVVKNYSGADSSVLNTPNDKSSEEESLIVLSTMHYIGKDSISSIETSWTKNQLAFNKERLEDIVSKIERWYDVKVIITDKSLNDEKYTGVFEEETLEQVMEALKWTGNFQYTINKKEVIISR